MERGSRIAGRYTLVGPLGAGRGGQVWTADDARTSVRVAIKLRHDPIAPGAEARTDVELSGLRDLEHPHLVRILDAGIDVGGTAYVVSELVASGSLDHIPKPLAPAALDALAAQMLDALAYLHAHGILHADVKTENVFVVSLDPPQFKLGDFGFAHRRTGDGALRGSPAFLAPEVIRGEPADERSDLYALGILLYECAFGAVPFGDRDVRRVLKRQLTETPERLGDPGDVNPRLVALLRRLLPKEPAERPSDARAALAAWRGDEAGLPTWVPPHLGVLIGRDAEMAMLSQLLAAGGGAVAIDGPPGIGKTRLLREFALRAELDGAHVEWWTPAVGATSSGAARGSVVIIEDLDRSSPWSREAAANRIRDELIGARGSLVCVTGRGAAAESLADTLAAGQFPPPHTIELHPWSMSEVLKACAAILGAQAIDPSLASIVMEATSGIPAGVEVACRALVDHRLLVGGARGALAVPATESAARLAARISHLRKDSLQGMSDNELALLQTLAVLDRPVSVAWLSSLHDCAQMVLPRLVRNALVSASSTAEGVLYSISDAAFRRVVLASISDRLQQRLHDRVAAAFAVMHDTSAADYHRAQGSKLDDAYAALQRFSATEQALFAPDTTAHLYHRILEAWPRGHAQEAYRTTQLQLLDLTLRVGDLDHVVELAHDILGRTRDRHHAQAIRNRIARVHITRSDAASALAVLDHSETPSDVESQLLRASALERASDHAAVLAITSRCLPTLRKSSSAWHECIGLQTTALNAVGRFTECESILITAIAAAETSGDKRSLALHLSHLGPALFYQGRLQDAEAPLRRAHELYRQLGDRANEVRLLNSVAAVYGESGRISEAGDTLRVALDLSRRIGALQSTFTILSNLAEMMALLGRFREAIAHAAAAIAMATRPELHHDLAGLLICRAKILATIGAIDACNDDVARARAQELELLHQAQIMMVVAEVLLLSGNPEASDSALSTSRDTIMSINARDELVHHGLLQAKVELARGNSAAALESAVATLELARELGFAGGVALAELQVAEVSLLVDLATSASLGRMALDGAQALGLREACWRAHHVLAQAAALSSDWDTCLLHYTQCVALLRDQCDDVPGDLVDAYLAHPDRARVFVELDRVRKQVSGATTTGDET